MKSEWQRRWIPMDRTKLCIALLTLIVIVLVFRTELTEWVCSILAEML